jgi:dipeptidyl aminopeptidase/acylaminoacyl peptidase
MNRFNSNGTGMKSLQILFLILLCCLFNPSKKVEAMTLESLLGAPFPSELITADSADRIAWIFNQEGRRNIWIADGPDYTPHQLTKFDQDDGQELHQIIFSQDGSMIAYVRGDFANDQNENPNPTSNPKGAKEEVWIMNISGGEPKRIGEGSQPSISPDGREIIFVRSRSVYHAALEGSKEPEEFFHARGGISSPRWSPDGSKLAFVSDRSDHSFVGVLDVKNQTITWLTPSVDRDLNPVWSRDGKQLAYFRFPGLTKDPQDREIPSTSVSIWIADPESGKGREIWKSKNQTAGFAEFYYAAVPLFWAQDRLVFYSEMDGWMRLYSVSISGGEAQAISPKTCEVEDAALSADRKEIIFSSNCNDVDRRHLWIAPVSGSSQAKQLTSGSSLEWAPAAPAGGKKIALIQAGPKQPAAPATVEISGGNPKLLAPQLLKDVPMRELVEPQQVIFKSGDGLEIHGQLFVPAQAKSGAKLPALIFMHGGPIRQMLLGFHYFSYYTNAYALNQYLASKGYIALSVNYRSGIGYGRAFRTAEHQGPRGASEYQDILAAAKFLRERPDIDPNRIGLWGGSYGGYLTALGLARDSDLFAAGVDLHGVHDWSFRAKLHGDTDWGIHGDAMMQEAFRSSPVADIRFWTSPVLFIIGDDDRNVDFAETTDLVQRLRTQGNVTIETLILPDEVHDFLRYATWLKAYKATEDFFDRHLKSKK